jgi:ribosomal protein S17E
MAKYKQYVQKMLDENKLIFDEFQKLHDKYELNPDALQDEFNEKGEKILEIVHEYESRLCRNTERGMYNKFSTGLAEKFQNELKRRFPMIDHVGLIVKKFSIKKINLS